MQCWVLLCYLGPLAVFVTIGLPCWIVGCNPDLPGGCLTRELDNMTYTGKVLVTDVCCSTCSKQVCSTNKDGSQSCHTEYWCCGGRTCFTCDYKWEKTADKDGSCTFQCGGVYYSATDALNPATSIYQLNSTAILAYDPRTHICTTKGASKATWVTGITFLSLAAVVLTCLLLHLCWEVVSECQCDWDCPSLVVPDYGSRDLGKSLQKNDSEMNSVKADPPDLPDPPAPTVEMNDSSSEPRPPSSNPNVAAENETYGLCSICQDERSNILLLPCRHQCLCAGCFAKWQTSCPVCRGVVVSHEKAYLS
jgi:hypothetical protein